MATRNPVRVLPEPVGAAIRVSSPRRMEGQPRSWGADGPSGNRRANHSATTGWRSVVGARLAIPPFNHRGVSTRSGRAGGATARCRGGAPNKYHYY